MTAARETYTRDHGGQRGGCPVPPGGSHYIWGCAAHLPLRRGLNTGPLPGMDDICPGDDDSGSVHVGAGVRVRCPGHSSDRSADADQAL